MGSRCERATASAHALGSPERGAVTAQSAVTEGLVQGGCGVITLPVNLRNPLTAGAYLPRPPGVGRWTTSDARVKWCAGCDARDRICVEADVTVRTVGNKVAIGHAERPQRKGERGGRVARGNDAVCRPTDGTPRTVRPTRRDATINNKPTSSVNQRKGRRGRRPLRGV